MCRILSCILLLALALLATGAPQYLHALQHEREDALGIDDDALASPQVFSTAVADPAHPNPMPRSHHDEPCALCLQLRAPLVLQTWTVLLIDSGQWVRYVSLLAISQHSQTSPARPTCRGPPEYLLYSV